MKCNLKKDAEGRAICPRCGFRSKAINLPLPWHPGDCPAWPAWHEFGNWTAIVLEAAGMSKARWAWLWAKAGMVEPTGCNSCDARERWLNTWGGKLEMRRRAMVKWITRAGDREMTRQDAPR